MKVTDSKGKAFTLSDSTFVAYGGEADVHAIGNTVYKIYHKQMSDAYGAKLRELSNLKHKNIIAPVDILKTESNTLAGYTMPYIQSVEPMAKLMAKSYKIRNNITNDSILELLVQMREIYSYIHQHKCVVVDGNDNNILFRKDNVAYPYFIDVDSYKTPNYNAGAYSPLITDPKVNVTQMNFCEESDWYSYAIISFQLLTNIHPFKGKHPKYTQKQVLDRMRDGVSVFNKDVKLPGSAEGFDVIPLGLKKWYEEIFSNKNRTAPPVDFTKNAEIKPRETVVRDSKVVSVIETSARNPKTASSIFTAEIVGGKVCLKKVWNGREIYDPMTMPVHSSAKMFYNVAYYQLGPVHHVVVNNSLGTTAKLFHTILELPKNAKVMDMAYDKGILLVSYREADGTFKLNVFKLGTGFSMKFNAGYEIETTSFSECNFAQLDKGIVIVLTGDGDIVLTHKHSEQYKTVLGSNVPGEADMYTIGDDLFIEYNGKNYKVKVN